jgi:hypothetical protein
MLARYQVSMHMTTDEVSAAELLSFLRELTDSCVNDANALKFEKTPRRHLYTASAYGTIVELSLGILALVEKHQLTSPSVFFSELSGGLCQLSLLRQRPEPL